MRAAPLGNLRQAKILTLSRQLAEPVEAQGLHSLFACLHTINPAVVFFCHTFCNQPFFHSVVFLNHYFNPPTGKEVGVHSNLHHHVRLAPEKKQPEAKFITCSYMRFFILRTPLRFGENTLKKAYNQIMYNSRTRSTLCPLRCPKSLKISPPPISCAENKKHVVICLPCACSI